LERVFPPERISDPADPAAAANGQYLLVRREVYEALGGHNSVADKLLEDLELARLYKALHRKIWFRQGMGLVAARMYRNFGTMMEGWTRNLVLLFPNPLGLAAVRSLEFTVIITSLATAVSAWARRDYAVAIEALAAAGLFCGLFLRRILRAHFPAAANFMSFWGLPLYAGLLVRSWLHSRGRGAVTWKGRRYGHSAPEPPANSSMTGKS
jgi:glycosyl transferase family 21